LVKLSIGFEVSKVVGATDMRTIDEYLRHGVSARRFGQWPVGELG
jgi:hypothetical protein